MKSRAREIMMSAIGLICLTSPLSALAGPAEIMSVVESAKVPDNAPMKKLLKTVLSDLTAQGYEDTGATGGKFSLNMKTGKVGDGTYYHHLAKPGANAQELPLVLTYVVHLADPEKKETVGALMQVSVEPESNRATETQN